MATRVLLALLLVAVPAGAAAERRGPAAARAELEAMPLLDLYQTVISWGAVAFSCTPAVYAFGRERPGYEGARRKLRDRMRRVRDRLAAAYGEAAVAEIERLDAEGRSGVYRTGCDEHASPVGRARYRRLVELIERRTAALRRKR